MPIPSLRDQQQQQQISRKSLEKSFPFVRQVNQNDLKRQKQNQIYDRQLNEYLNGSKGLTWRLNYKLEQIKHDQRQLNRDLKNFPRISMPKKSTKTKLTSIDPIEIDAKQQLTTDDYLSSMLLINLRSNQSTTSVEKMPPANRYVSPYKRLFWFDYYQHQQKLKNQ